MIQGDAGKGSHRAVVILCFLLVTTTTTGILVFIDSSSLQIWVDSLDTGPVAMVVNGEGIETEIHNIRQIDGVTQAEVLEGARGHIRRGEGVGEISTDNVTQAFAVSGIVYAPSSSFIVEFDTMFNLLNGRFPENSSEVAIPRKVADIAFIGIGYQVNYSYTSLDIRTPLVVVGIYSQAILSGLDYYYDGIGIVHPSLVNPASAFARVFVNVDRTPVAPQDAFGALTYVNGIDYSIRDLYPGDVYLSRYRVDNYLAAGINSYIDWRDNQRFAQLLRAGATGLLILMVSFTGVQYSIQERRKYCLHLYSRGATRRRISLSFFQEIAILSIMAAPIGILLGIFVSRFAIASDSFLELNLTKLVHEPTLIAQDSLIMAVALG
ncbi:FtsX-like permease family protein, partial [Candidatus Thorarchaeota archaeon]